MYTCLTFIDRTAPLYLCELIEQIHGLQSTSLITVSDQHPLNIRYLDGVGRTPEQF